MFQERILQQSNVFNSFPNIAHTCSSLLKKNQLLPCSDASLIQCLFVVKVAAHSHCYALSFTNWHVIQQPHHICYRHCNEKVVNQSIRTSIVIKANEVIKSGKELNRNHNEFTNTYILTLFFFSVAYLQMCPSLSTAYRVRQFLSQGDFGVRIIFDSPFTWANNISGRAISA